MRRVESAAVAADREGDDDRYRVFLSHSRRKYAFFCAIAGRAYRTISTFA